jgi:hypothetical protein
MKQAKNRKKISSYKVCATVQFTTKILKLQQTGLPAVFRRFVSVDYNIRVLSVTGSLTDGLWNHTMGLKKFYISGPTLSHCDGDLLVTCNHYSRGIFEIFAFHRRSLGANCTIH